ncbi:unnamed protein product [Notodromas monacha]|uniref:V-SNARE coiled-coil homology domain-containing protein n=1 Tax=Notodromas monacha TaxID=399045 RepID=A0A7R9BYA3_9CRUS|nr:unnamed protein product [Notodromas monacha]CAG0923972.1 unnamed protein product [Notodromas monacha]
MGLGVPLVTQDGRSLARGPLRRRTLIGSDQANPAGDGGANDGPARNPQNVAAQKRLQQTHAQVEEVVGIMRMNVEKVLERDQKLSELDDRAGAIEMLAQFMPYCEFHKFCYYSDALQQGASQFEQSAGKLKNKFWLQNMKMMIAMGAVGLIFLVIIF